MVKAKSACNEERECDSFAIRIRGKADYGSTYITFKGTSCVDKHQYSDVYWNLYRKTVVPARTTTWSITQVQSSPSAAGKLVALGCTSLLKAKSNGKMEWFENQAWYRKALKMCTSISGRSPKEMEGSIGIKQKQALSRMAALRDRSPIELMKRTCAKLGSVPLNHEVRTHVWYSKAEQMCSTVGDKSPEELKSMLHRSQTQAETASGQLLKETCEKLKAALYQRKFERFQHELWYSSAVSMCAKLGDRKVGANSLARKCVRFTNVERRSQKCSSDHAETQECITVARVKMMPWYKQLAATCEWISRGATPNVHPTKEGLRNKPIFV